MQNVIDEQNELIEILACLRVCVKRRRKTTLRRLKLRLFNRQRVLTDVSGIFEFQKIAIFWNSDERLAKTFLNMVKFSEKGVCLFWERTNLIFEGTVT